MIGWMRETVGLLCEYMYLRSELEIWSSVSGIQGR